MVLTLAAAFLGFFTLATLGWLIATPIENVTENYDSVGGHLVYRQTDVDLTSLLIPAALCAISLAGFIASTFALVRTLREAA